VGPNPHRGNRSARLRRGLRTRLTWIPSFVLSAATGPELFGCDVHTFVWVGHWPSANFDGATYAVSTGSTSVRDKSGSGSFPTTSFALILMAFTELVAPVCRTMAMANKTMAR
jgi:hypothetical protein